MATSCGGSGSRSACVGFVTFSCGLESFRFRIGKPLVIVLVGDVGSFSLPELEFNERSAIGFSTPEPPFDFCSWAFFFLAAAKACNLDILGAPSEEPPSNPPLGYRGAINTACRSWGVFNHGISPKKSLYEKGVEQSNPAQSVRVPPSNINEK